MKKRFAKWTVVWLALVMVLAGCGGNKDGNNGGGQASKQTDSGSHADNQSSGGNSGKKVLVTAFSSQGPRITSFNDNTMTQKIEQKLGINIDFKTAPQDGAKDKQNLLLASGDYPDAFIGGDFSKVDQLKYGSQGILVPLNDLIEQYAPNVKKAFEEVPGLKEGLTAPDGNIYALPGLDGCDHCMYPAKLWLNKKWLDNLHLSMPTTTEEFEKVLEAFKNKDPNGNGKPDEIPLSGYIQTGSQWSNPVTFLMNAFIYDNPTNYMHVKDGKVALVADDEGWKAGLSYIRGLYNKGLIDPAAFTQNLEGIQQEANNPGKVILGAFSDLWNGDVVTIYGDSDGRWTNYFGVAPLKGPQGKQYATYTEDAVPSGKFAITNKANKDQQIAAIKIADYLFSKEGGLDAFQGVKGWIDATPDQKGIDGKPAIWDTAPGGMDWEAPSHSIWENGFYYMSKQLYLGQAVSQDINVQDGNETRLYQANEQYIGHEPPKEERLPDVFIDPKQAQTVAELQTTINKYIEQSEVQFILGKKDLNKDWDAYVQGLKDLGLDKYLGIYQDAYDKQKNK